MYELYDLLNRPGPLWLAYADLSGKYLTEANFVGANLRGANLKGAVIVRADLRRANLEEAHLDRADLRGALYDSQTRWPAGFDPGRAGAKKVD